ncbi:hypothetical protein [Bailinhaonella thermotolerans]|uniref:Uncharacterized protein n=1 Tax=Bailinhaonella thermotolerans TaxID=1070861 RepID=A0A3A4BBI8_9ACTN|nr:hypothetical protein [Bailinhaonella thermotolerans]RJL35466.1 hypothetical protein D5H75_01240 [Bailinhaonella thermotolerans]
MTTIAVVLPLVWLAWLALIDWVPMFPLNDLTPGNLRARVLAAVINYPFPLLIAAGVALHETWSLIAALVLCAMTFAGHLASWWVPYFGLSSAAQREVYARDYSRTLKILPTAGRAVVPDVQHMVVGVLTLAMLGTTLAVTLNA